MNCIYWTGVYVRYQSTPCPSSHCLSIFVLVSLSSCPQELDNLLRCPSNVSRLFPSRSHTSDVGHLSIVLPFPQLPSSAASLVHVSWAKYLSSIWSPSSQFARGVALFVSPGPSYRSLHKDLRHADQCREDQTGYQQHRWHQHWHQGQRRETRLRQHLQIPGSNHHRWRIQTWNSLQDRPDHSSTRQTQDHLENSAELKDQTDALPGHVRIPIRIWVLDTNNRNREKDTRHRDEMPQKAPWRHLQWPHLQRRGAKQNSASHWAPRKPLEHSDANWNGTGT